MSTLTATDEFPIGASLHFQYLFEELAGEEWDDERALSTLMMREGRDAAADILATAWAQELIGARALQSNIGWAWSGPEYPLQALGEDQWRELFQAAGYTYNGRRRARRKRSTRLYRGATPSGARGWSWTTNLETAKSFAFGRMRGRPIGCVWTLMAPPEAVLAVISDQRDQEAEFVCDPRLLPQPTAWAGRPSPVHQTGSHLGTGVSTEPPDSTARADSGIEQPTTQGCLRRPTGYSPGTP